MAACEVLFLLVAINSTKNQVELFEISSLQIISQACSRSQLVHSKDLMHQIIHVATTGATVELKKLADRNAMINWKHIDATYFFKLLLFRP